ncbi:hypothetical protein [Natrialba sp. PRR66]|uniref:DUF7344 domain-containing protein n=1 Tax=Natrialba sp. PRR66 TaxID=3098146 RepID=UPI002B1D24AF|nr:hypothetical protein [Natrialba sp. PRR66]
MTGWDDFAATDIDRIVSKLYHALRATRRRHVIRLLRNTDETTLTTKETARKIASLEQGVVIEQATGEPYRNVYNALSQTHLPTLSSADIIIYEPKRQRISRGPYFQMAALLIETNTPTVNVFISLTEATEDEECR